MSTQSEKKLNDWMTTKWRPMMAIVYMAINICDFIIFPVLWTTVQYLQSSNSDITLIQWDPMSLQYGGLMHVAFGAILGISAWTRGQEKVQSLKSGNSSEEE